VVNGEAVTELRRVQQITGAELNPRFQDGSVFQTAKSAHSIGLTKITPDALITIAGVEAPCKVFEDAGLIHRDARGEYQEGSGRADALQETPEGEIEGSSSDAVGMPDEVFL
jgi:hypothetical protein